MSMNSPSRQQGSIFELEFPQSVAVYASYDKAQEAVDFLADEKFEVKNLCIVGTELKSVERVLGRKTWKTVLTQAVLSGISTGLLVGLLLLFFINPQAGPVMLIAAVVVAVIISIIFQAIAYSVSGGRRDFTSLQQTVATKYEILSEHKVAQQARDLLATMPGARAAAFD